ncbi:glycoside hydrolase family 72 protein [Coniella lustricola]|uniref:1,3-beta-glucanosyltransferase n=1 Tax=Coniella lustricola TaxID=2025994 RepID=A0A2T2ZTY5_9PEZI|nr:glycoside hydrolase family 72 protein [Coniella lustricola]
MFSAKQLALAAILGQVSATVEPIVMKGQHFFYENGTEFYIKGIAYQRDPTDSTEYIDPLSDATRCKRDVPILAAAGTNVIRTYALDPTADHDTCMSLLADAGIYVISDLSSPDVAINRADPVWDLELYDRYTSVIDAMSGYKNVIGFFGGNEVTNDANNTVASAFVKAAVRDMKAYINSTADRWMGVGYAANDDATIRDNIAHYFNCGDQDNAIDFWGYNIYEWCGESTFTTSGYSEVVDFFSNYSVPVFFSEYGCNNDGAAERIFEETTELYSSDMTSVIAGGIVYMYFQETNDYGLVSDINSESVSTLKDYTSLSSRVNAASPSSTSMDAYTATNSPAACPAVNSDWQAANILPPTPDASLCECMYESLSCVPAADLNGTEYSSIYSYVCGEDDAYCAGILANGTSGIYGAYSMCNSTQMLGYVLDQYYQGQGSDASACSFSGNAVTQSAATASGCSAKLASASSANAVAATATAGTTATGTGSSSSSSGTGSSSAGYPSAHRAFFSIGDLTVGVYMVAAMGAGFAMFAL